MGREKVKTRAMAKTNNEPGKVNPEKSEVDKLEKGEKMGIPHKTLYKKETPNIPT
ncbi:MAG: hypothetical protein VZQ98_13165 [Bacteroidales bacterium]|nr:hypothetical protein [Bacteroidales bacterium]